jgi:hypothetical protein
VVDLAVVVVGSRVVVVVVNTGEEVEGVTAATVVEVDDTDASGVEAVSPEHATGTRERATRRKRTPKPPPPLRCLGSVRADPGAFTRRT